MQVWNDRRGIKYGFIMQKAPVVLHFSLSHHLFSLQPSDSRFPQRHGGSSENIVPLPALCEPSASTPTFLSPTSTYASSYLVTRALFFFPPQPPTIMILFHRTWPLPVPLFTTLTCTRAHASDPHSKIQRGHQFLDASKSAPASVTGRRWPAAA